MIGRLDPELRRAVVVGGGFSGLLAAYRLEKAGYEVDLLESSQRLGGLIATRQTDHGLVESAAHSFIATLAVESLCAELGVELVPVRGNSKARFIFRDGKARRMPLRTPGILDLARRMLFARSGADEASLTVREWGDRHLGSEAVDWLLNPGLRGIYAARPEELLIGAAFPKMVGQPGESLFKTLMRRRRETRQSTSGWRDQSLARGARGHMKVPVRGVQALTDAMADSLRRSSRVRIHLGRPVEDLEKDLAEFGPANWILTVPAPVLGRLLSRHDWEASRALSMVRYAPLLSVTAFVDRSRVPASLRGVGVLVPEKESGRSALGILLTSSPFPGRVVDESRLASFTLIFGGTSRPDLLDSSDAAVSEMVERELHAILGVEGGVESVHPHRWKAAIPIYGADLVRAWRTLEGGFCSRPGRVVFGNHSGEVSLRGMIETSSELSSVRRN